MTESKQFDVDARASSLLFSARNEPLHAQLGDGRIVNISVSADEEHDVFVVGRFKRFAHAHRHGLDGGDLLKADDAIGSVRIFRIVCKGEQGFPRRFSEACIVPLGSTYAAGSEDVLAVEDCVVYQALPAVDAVLYQETLDPGLVLVGDFTLCEGPLTARSVAGSSLYGRIPQPEVQEAA